MRQPDATDRKILNLLQADARLTHKELAAQLNLSITPVYERVRRLEREGFITGYTARLDRIKVGKSLMVFCSVALSRHVREHLAEFESGIVQHPEVMACYHVTGAYDYLLQVVVNDMEAYQQFIVEKLSGMPFVGQVQSHFVMTEVKNDMIIPISSEG